MKTLDIDAIAGTHALTREDLKALRRAERVSFFRTPTRSYIKASREKTDASDFDLNHEIPAYSTIDLCVPDHKTWDDSKTPLVEVAYCHHLLYVYQEEDHWATIAWLLKGGDRLEMYWYRDAATNGYMKDANLHGDTLNLIVHRSEKGRRKKLIFLIERQTCQDNTARMIRRGAYNNE